MFLTVWKDVPSLTMFSNSMFIFLISQLQILASAFQEMRISSFQTKSQILKDPVASFFAKFPMMTTQNFCQ